MDPFRYTSIHWDHSIIEFKTSFDGFDGAFGATFDGLFDGINTAFDYDLTADEPFQGSPTFC
jgi:hypothetical protein